MVMEATVILPEYTGSYHWGHRGGESRGGHCMVEEVTWRRVDVGRSSISYEVSGMVRSI